jgi:hypothetical protein
MIDVVRAPQGRELPVEIGGFVGKLGGADQYAESGPDASRIAMSLAPISSIAVSQLTRTQEPLRSFIGYFSLRSPWTASRAAAPLAQCEPRLNGDSQAGSWPTHTPFATSPAMVQPTAQNVQTPLRTVTSASRLAGVPACAVRRPVSGRAPSAVIPPATRPERRRKARRLTSLPD